MSVDRAGLKAIAEQCVSLVETEFAVSLDWTPDSLDALDAVCARLRGEGGLVGDRLDLWWKLVGSYLGEVVVRAYGGEWVVHDQAGGAYAVSTRGVTGFPFSVTARVLEGEEFKTLATFARSIPATGGAPGSGAAG